MIELPVDAQVFISSTYLDLGPVRAELIRRLHEVFGARLIVMETFGSDDAPPEVLSVRRVRQADAFIGVYARRYGSTDPRSGKSITQLELEEAEAALSGGLLKTILLYVLAEEARWLSEGEADESGRQGLTRLLGLAGRHTYTRFSRTEDLPFFVIRDLFVALRDRLAPSVPALRRPSLPPRTTITRPVGMEYLRSTEREYLAGRKDKVDELLRLVDEHPLVLLLGGTGVGKTSLIHAGVFPSVLERGWYPVYARPLGFPHTDLLRQVEASVFEGQPGYRGALLGLLGYISAQFAGRRLLIVLDQFEDVLGGDPEEARRLIHDLGEAHRLSEPTIRILISYRADLEGRLGYHWQGMTGSPAGLPRCYLSGIEASEALVAIKRMALDLGTALELRAEDERQIEIDLILASTKIGIDGVYPPYVQMLVDHLWMTATRQGTAYTSADYASAGGADSIVGTYLVRLLDYAEDQDRHLRRLLGLLVRADGSRLQRTLEQLAEGLRLAPAQCEPLLERLIDLRLVRYLDAGYELSHDFLAQAVLAEIVEPAERDLKRLQDLLDTKAINFDTTRSLLTSTETLLLFQQGDRLTLGQAQLRLFLASWVAGLGPGLARILRGDPTVMVRELDQEMEVQNPDRDEKALAVLLRRHLAGTALPEGDWRVFRSFQLARELTALLEREGALCGRDTLVWALRSRHRSVRHAALFAVAQQIRTGDSGWLHRLRGSGSARLREAFELLAAGASLSDSPLKFLATDRGHIREFALLWDVAHSKRHRDLRDSQRILSQLWMDRRARCFRDGLLTLRRRGLEALLRRTSSASARETTIRLGAVHRLGSLRDMRTLLGTYRRQNETELHSIESGRAGSTKSAEEKARALGEAILRAAEPRDLPLLRVNLRRLALTPSAELIALATLRLGNSEDVEHLCDRLFREDREVRYWHQIEIALAAETCASRYSQPLSPRMAALMDWDGFWGYTSKAPNSGGTRSLRNQQNRLLLVRIAAHALIGASGSNDIDRLERLAMHPYRMIARRATLRLATIDALHSWDRLRRLAGEAVRAERVAPVSAAVRDVEAHLLGLLNLSG
jgi:hypothetical protein